MSLAIAAESRLLHAIEKSELKLESTIADLRAEIFKMMFAQTIVVVGLIFTLMKFFG